MKAGGQEFWRTVCFCITVEKFIMGFISFFSTVSANIRTVSWNICWSESNRKNRMPGQFAESEEPGLSGGFWLYPCGSAKGLHGECSGKISDNRCKTGFFPDWLPRKAAGYPNLRHSWWAFQGEACEKKNTDYLHLLRLHEAGALPNRGQLWS